MSERIPVRGGYSGFVTWTRPWAIPIALWLLVLALVPLTALAATAQQPPGSQPAAELRVSVVDENGNAVPSARLTLIPQAGTPVHGETDYAGRKDFPGLAPGDYSLRAEKEGYFAVTQPHIPVGEVASAELTLNHVREFSEHVNVVYSPPAIDPAKTQASSTLTNSQIIDIPFPVDRDIRYSLPYLPGVLQDANGQLHVDGASTRQVYDQIDDFNVSDPTAGLFLTRVSVDAVQSAEVESSRYSAQYGKGSGGMISLLTGNGDDHWRAIGTDFFPGVADRRGFNINNWTPRAVVSGPIVPGKAWFMNALEGEYAETVYTELPPGGDRSYVFRSSNFSKVQVNLAQNNNLTVGLLLNYIESPRNGLDPLDPLSTTQHYLANMYMLTAKDQHLFQNGVLMEAGIADSSFYSSTVPRGTQPYIETPNGTSGNYYLTNHGRSRRTQAIGNVFLPTRHAAGKHLFKMGVDFDRLADYQDYIRQPYLVERANGTLSRSVSFTNATPFMRYNAEESGYLQDRWSLTQRLLLEPGVRFDADQIVRGVAVSPRLASTYLLRRNGNTKISWGVGVYRDASNLDILTRSLTGARTDSFYDPTGMYLLQPPVVSTFTVNQNQLRSSFATNASIALEQKLPATTYLRLQLMDRRAKNIWSFVNPAASTLPNGPFGGNFMLTNDRQDHYESAEFTLRHVFRQNHTLFASYVRSRSLSNADFSYNIDNVLFSPQAGGPLAWDAPNRLISWGWLPVTHKIDGGYTVDWRTGYPFSLQNDSQEVVGAPDSQRFPAYFSLDVSLERRFTILKAQWAVRVGVDNITKHGNYDYVNSNIDSPDFLSYSGAPGRAFIARIRLLGRK